jgi:hypothetical protein
MIHETVLSDRRYVRTTITTTTYVVPSVAVKSLMLESEVNAEPCEVTRVRAEFNTGCVHTRYAIATTYGIEPIHVAFMKSTMSVSVARVT